jgi:hypothetical protein
MSIANIINVPADIDSIQGGINLANPGDTVLVQPGTYVENINFNGKNIVVGSLTLTTGDTSFISQTVIDGDSSDNVVHFENGEDSTALLCGFTLTNGMSYLGSGIVITNSSPVVSNMLIIKNGGDFGLTNEPVGGGGIYFDSSNSKISNTSIISNVAEARTIFMLLPHGEGGGILCKNSNLRLTNMRIINNGSIDGGGIKCINSNIVLNNVVIKDNGARGGGGIFVGNWNETDESNLSLSNVTIKSNDAWKHGGGFFFSDSLTRIIFDNLNRCNIYQNTAETIGNDLYTCTDSIITVVVDTFTVLNPDSFHTYPLNKYSFDILHDTSGNLNSVEKKHNIPQKFLLKQNYPNPFNPITTIEFSIPKAEFVTLKIYNLLGQEKITLVSDKLTSGNYTYSWDASGYASGIYYYTLVTGEYSQTKKLLLIK